MGGQASLLLQDNRFDGRLGDAATGLPDGWQRPVAQFLASPDGQRLAEHLARRCAEGIEVYPADPLRALRELAPGDVRVVILGQDPYHGPGEAQGLAFSVPAGVKIPPSLRNIRQELAADLGLALPPDGDLSRWARAGVLLLNTSLSVERDRPASHAKLGWEWLTDQLVSAVAAEPHPKVFMLWGAHAQAKAGLIKAAGAGRHLVLQSNHPSPLAARRPPLPFLGSRPFSRANAWLAAQGVAPVDWRLNAQEA
jgi:uracil-DNA glycosylase